MNMIGCYSSAGGQAASERDSNRTGCMICSLSTDTDNYLAQVNTTFIYLLLFCSFSFYLSFFFSAFIGRLQNNFKHYPQLYQSCLILCLLS